MADNSKYDELFLALAENSPSMVFINHKGRIVYANANCTQVMGYSNEELLADGFNFKKLVAKEYIPELEKNLAAHVAGLDVEPLDYELVTRDGKRLFSTIRTKLISLGGDKAMLVIVTDVSSYREAISRQKQTDDKLLEIMDNVPVGIVKIGEKGNFISANATLLQMLGFSRVEDMSFHNINDDYSYDNADKLTDVALKHGGVTGYGARWITRLGDPLYVRINLKVVKSGDECCFDGTVENVSDRKSTEERLKYAIDLEKVSSRISSHFVNLSVDMEDNGIDFALKLIGQFLGTDRSFVALLSDDKQSLSLVNEWVCHDIGHLMWETNENREDDFPWMFKSIRQRKTIVANSLWELPAEAIHEKKHWEEKGIKSRVMDPLVVDGEIIGVLGFDAVRKARLWTDDIVSVLRVTGEMISSAIKRKKDHEQLEKRVLQEAFVASLAKRFVNSKSRNTDGIINDSLKDICNFCGSDAANILCLSEDSRTVLYLNSWRNEMSAGLQNEIAGASHGTEVPAELLEQLKRGMIRMVSLTSIDPARSFMAAYMRRVGAKSILMLPIRRKHGNIYVLEVISSEGESDWSEANMSLVRMAVEIFSGAMELRDSSRELDHERKLLTSMMDSIPDFISFRDKLSRYVRVNKSFAMAFGDGDPVGFVGKSIRDVMPEEIADSIIKDEIAVMESARPIVDKERYLVLPGKSNMWLSVTLMPLFDEDGLVSGTYCISRNITVKKRAEMDERKAMERNYHAQKLESLGVMCSGIAHDFNNFLMGILGNLSLAMLESKHESPVWQTLKQAETMALRAAELTGQLLIYSGKSIAVKQLVNVTALVKEMSHLLHLSLSKNIKLVAKYNDDVMPVECDPAQIRQVVMNIIINAAQAIGEKHGTITLSTGMVNCDEAFLGDCYASQNKAAGDYVLIEISDTGCGMTSEVKERLFDPFFTTKPQGHGLGMSAVMGVLTAHNGVLKLYSEVGKGSAFKILLPAVKGGAVNKEEDAVAVSARKRGAFIAIVEDDDIVSHVITKILEKEGYKTKLFVNGSSFLRFIREKSGDKVDMVLLDMTLPDTQGDKVLESLRKMHKHLPVVLMSGYSEAVATSGINQTSFSGFIQKPFTVAKILKKLAELL